MPVTIAHWPNSSSLNRLHRLLVDLVPAGASRNLTANHAAALLS